MNLLSTEELKLKIDNAKKLVQVGGRYRNFKGGEYKVVDIVLHSETLEEMVLYKPLYKTEVKLWVRPLSMFISEVEVGRKKVSRFALIS